MVPRPATDGLMQLDGTPLVAVREIYLLPHVGNTGYRRMRRRS